MSTIAQTAQISLQSAALLNGGTLPSPLSATSKNSAPALVTEAAQLAQEADLVVNLSNTTSDTNDDTYNAAGLLNSFSVAGTLQGTPLSASASSASTSGASTAVQQSTTAGIVQQTLGGTTTTSAGGPLADLSSNWTTLLQNNPELAGEAAQSSINGQIVNTLA